MATDTQQTVVGHVKVMRSHDYCHFEIQLPLYQQDVNIAGDVDCIRKSAMRLCDKAVLQYKHAKQVREMRGRTDEAWLRAEADKATKTPESEWTPEQKAAVKAFNDYIHWKNLDFIYGYEDEDEQYFDYGED